MFKTIVRFGLIAGLIVAIPMVVLMVGFSPATFEAGGLLYGYLSMIAALTMVFLGVKHYRDTVRGGTIKFGPALGVGLGISAVASLLYAVGWEVSLALTGFDFADSYYRSLIDAARAKGTSEAELQQLIADGKSFAAWYSKPWLRMPMSFVEMFPVGLLISLISAALLRNSRLLPARANAGA
jgi:hypothetical protein